MIFYIFISSFQQSAVICKKDDIHLNWIDIILRCDLDRKQAIHSHNVDVITSGVKNYIKRGKYAYLPILEFNEFISGMLSIMSMLVVVVCYCRCRLGNNVMDNLRLILGLATYIASTVFHMRDTSFTTFLDYGMALIYVNFNVIHKLVNFTRMHGKSKILIISKNIIAFLYFLNVLYFIFNLNKITCDILKNMFVLPVIAGSSCMIVNRLMKRCSFVYRSIFILAVGFAVERMNLPPYRFLFDSHAVWHLCVFLGEIFSFKCLVSEYREIGKMKRRSD